MTRTREHHPGTPAPAGLRDLHERLSVVLGDLEFPAQRWQLVAAADLYGVDGVTRAIIERAPEQRFHTLAEVVTVIGMTLGRRPVAAPVPTPQVLQAPPIPQQRTRPVAVPPPRARRSGTSGVARTAVRAQHPAAPRGAAPGSPQPAA